MMPLPQSEFMAEIERPAPAPASGEELRVDRTGTELHPSPASGLQRKNDHPPCPSGSLESIIDWLPQASM